MSVELVVRAIDRSVLGTIEPDSCDWLNDLALASSLNAAWTVEPADLDRVVHLLDIEDGWRIVDVRVRGEPAHSYVVDHVKIDRDEDGSQSWRLTAAGAEQLLAGLPVLPEVRDELAGGPVDERIFGPGSYRRFRDVDNWSDAQSITTLAAACDSDVAYKCAGHGPYPREGKWATDEDDLLDDGVSEAEASDRDGEFPDQDAHWLAPPVMDLPDDRTVPPGSWWLRREFTLTEGLDFVVLATADEHFALYIDGVEMTATHGDVYQWQSWEAVEVGLPAGTHVIAARIDVVQRPCADGFCDSSTSFLLAMWEVDTEEPPDRLDNVAPFLRTDTDSAWRCSDVNRETGWTPGEVLIDLRDTAEAEASGDAVLPPPVRLTPTFDAAVDSAGRGWGTLVDFALNVTRSGGMEAVRKLIENDVDVGVDFPAGELNAWNERGVDRTIDAGQVELTADRDVLTAGWELTAPSANSVKTRFRYGTVVVDSQRDVDRFGRVWAPLSLGDALDDRQARSIGRRVLDEAAGGRETVPLSLADEGPGAQPLVDVRLGDHVWHDDRRRRRRRVRVHALTGRYQGERGVSWEVEVQPPSARTEPVMWDGVVVTWDGIRATWSRR